MEQEIKKLYQVAQMYYEQDLTQNQIAKELGVNRVTVSRMLKKIREKEIVQIRINYDVFQDMDIARKLKEKYQLKEVILIPERLNQSGADQLKAMGQACAEFLDRVVKEDDVIGFSWGTALAAVADELTPDKPKEEIICVPLVGGPDGKMESSYHANSIVYDTARKWRGYSKLIDVPAIVQNAEIRESLISSAHFKEIQQLWERLTVAVVGIGSPLISEGPNWRAFYGENFIEGDITGDICSNFYDKSGNIIETPLYDRTISVGINDLKQTRYSVGVAHSSKKAEAIRVAIQSGFLNVLVTTEETARELINEEVNV